MIQLITETILQDRNYKLKINHSIFSIKDRWINSIFNLVKKDIIDHSNYSIHENQSISQLVIK
jgi:hypothetical protein